MAALGAGNTPKDRPEREPRTDPTTVIVARTAALTYCPLDEALARMRAYAQTGVETIRLVGLRTRAQLEAVHQATALPLTVLSPPPDLMHVGRSLPPTASGF